MYDNTLKIAYTFDVGKKNSFFTNSKELARTVFQEVFPNSVETKSANFVPPEGTTLNIFISLLSTVAGLIVAEFVKELAKDLWKAVKKLILPKSKRQGNTSDEFQIEVMMGRKSARVSLSGLDGRSLKELKDFIDTNLPRLFNEVMQADTTIKSRDFITTMRKTPYNSKNVKRKGLRKH